MQRGLGRVTSFGSGYVPDWGWPYLDIFKSALKGMGAIALQLTTDKRSYQVGDVPLYTLQAAIPGSRVAWTSFKDGNHTGEFQADYGQVVDANGTAELRGGAFVEADAGADGRSSQWQKQVLVIAPDGATSVAQVFFSVSPKVGAAATPTPAPADEGFFNGSFDVAGQTIPKVAVYAVGAVVAYWAFGDKRR